MIPRPTKAQSRRPTAGWGSSASSVIVCGRSRPHPRPVAPAFRRLSGAAAPSKLRLGASALVIPPCGSGRAAPAPTTRTNARSIFKRSLRRPAAFHTKRHTQAADHNASPIRLPPSAAAELLASIPIPAHDARRASARRPPIPCLTRVARTPTTSSPPPVAPARSGHDSDVSSSASDYSCRTLRVTPGPVRGIGGVVHRRLLPLDAYRSSDRPASSRPQAEASCLRAAQAPRRSPVSVASVPKRKPERPRLDDWRRPVSRIAVPSRALAHARCSSQAE